ncbi:MAG: MoaD/ThiS family protein [Planctomycetota bacterium]
MSGDAKACDVRLFGRQAEIAGSGSVAVEVVAGSTTCAEVLTRLGEAVPGLLPSLGASVLAVDHAVASPMRRLEGGEELALIGLVGGG